MAVAAAFVCAVHAQEPAPAVKMQPKAGPPPIEQAKPEEPKADQADAPRKGKGSRELHREILGQLGQLDAMNDSQKGSGVDGHRPPPPSEAFNYDFMRKAVELNLSEDDRNSLKRLAFEKPDEFRDEMNKRFQAAHQKRVDEMRKTVDLQKAYRDAATPEAKQQALERIKDFVKEQFNQKMEMNKKRLEESQGNLLEAQRRLEDFKRKYDERKAKADEIVDERVKELVKDPDLDW